MQIPSADSLAAKVLQEECNMFDGLEHVNLYSFDGISKLAERCQLKLRKKESVISEIGVINNFLNYEEPYTGNSKNKLKLDILGMVNERVVLENLLGYKFQLVFSS